MSLRPEDVALVKHLEDVLLTELDRQWMDDEIGDGTSGESAYFDAISGELVGRPDFFKAMTAVVEAYWLEEGR